jgi:hypothetical protein
MKLRRNFVPILVALLGAFTLLLTPSSLAYALGPNAIRAGIGTANTLAANDDGSTGLVPIGFTANFFGNSYTSLYVNNNGNVTFTGPLSTYTPFGLTTTTGTPIIAPFFADVDTRGTGSALVTYGTATVNTHSAFVANWDGVGYYGGHTDKLNNFQMVLVDRSDTGAGNFDIEFNYDRIQWETGDASSGSNGFGGASAHAGYSNGSGTAGTFFEMPGSGVNGAFLDCVGTNQTSPCGVPNTTTGLIYHSLNSTQLGRYIFSVRNGVVAPPDTTPPTCALTAVIAGPPKQIQITVQDTDSGLGTVIATTANNATVVVPPFTVGTTSPVVVTATKIDQTMSAQVGLTVTDVAGNVTVCDPVLTALVRDAGRPEIQSFTGLARAESKVTIMNDANGVKKVELWVNGSKFKVADLTNGQTTTIDVAAAMRAGTNNTIEIRAIGAKGSSVTVVIHD